MPPTVATALFVVGIIGLFVFDRDRKPKTSLAIWIPLAWLLINGSRPITTWFETAPGLELLKASPEKYLEGSPVDAAIFGALMLMGLVALLMRQNRLGAFLRANGPIILFLAYCGLSTLWSDYTFVAFKRWLKVVGDFEMVLIILTDLEPTAALRRVLTRAAFVLLPLSILFIKYYPDIGRSYNLWNFEPMYGGVTTTKNELGMICLVFGLGCVWCFLTAYQEKRSNARTYRLIAHGTVIFMALWLLKIADSMTSMASFVLAGGLMVATTLNHVARKRSSVHLLVATTVGITFAALFLGLGGGALSAIGRDSTLTGRTDIWSIVLDMVRNPLLGTGFESFWLGPRLLHVWNDYGLHIQEAHNGYLEVYLNLGWIGVALLAFLIITAYKNVLRGLREKQDTASLMLAFFVAAVLYSFTEAGFRMLSPIWTAFLLVVTVRPKAAAPVVVPADEADAIPLPDVFEGEFDSLMDLEPHEDRY